MSWQEINQEPVVSHEEMERQRNFDSLVYRALHLNEAGKELMKLLDAHFYTPVAPPDKDSAWAYFREGQNNLIRQFKTAIMRHERLDRETKNGK